MFFRRVGILFILFAVSSGTLRAASPIRLKNYLELAPSPYTQEIQEIYQRLISHAQQMMEVGDLPEGSSGLFLKGFPTAPELKIVQDEHSSGYFHWGDKRIVLSTASVATFGGQIDAIAGVLAHELGHSAQSWDALQKYRKRAEQTADLFAVRLLQRAGFNPRGLSFALSQLSLPRDTDPEKPSAGLGHFSLLALVDEHDLTHIRVRVMDQEIRNLGFIQAPIDSSRQLGTLSYQIISPNAFEPLLSRITEFLRLHAQERVFSNRVLQDELLKYLTDLLEKNPKRKALLMTLIALDRVFGAQVGTVRELDSFLKLAREVFSGQKDALATLLSSRHFDWHTGRSKMPLETFDLTLVDRPIESMTLDQAWVALKQKAFRKFLDLQPPHWPIKIRQAEVDVLYGFFSQVDGRAFYPASWGQEGAFEAAKAMHDLGLSFRDPLENPEKYRLGPAPVRWGSPLFIRNFAFTSWIPFVHERLLQSWMDELRSRGLTSALESRLSELAEASLSAYADFGSRYLPPEMSALQEDAGPFALKSLSLTQRRLLAEGMRLLTSARAEKRGGAIRKLVAVVAPHLMNSDLSSMGSLIRGVLESSVAVDDILREALEDGVLPQLSPTEAEGVVALQKAILEQDGRDPVTQRADNPKLFQLYVTSGEDRISNRQLSPFVFSLLKIALPEEARSSDAPPIVWTLDRQLERTVEELRIQEDSFEYDYESSRSNRVMRRGLERMVQEQMDILRFWRQGVRVSPRHSDRAGYGEEDFRGRQQVEYRIESYDSTGTTDSYDLYYPTRNTPRGDRSIQLLMLEHILAAGTGDSAYSQQGQIQTLADMFLSSMDAREVLIPRVKKSKTARAVVDAFEQSLVNWENAKDELTSSATTILHFDPETSRDVFFRHGIEDAQRAAIAHMRDTLQWSRWALSERLWALQGISAHYNGTLVTDEALLKEIQNASIDEIQRIKPDLFNRIAVRSFVNPLSRAEFVGTAARALGSEAARVQFIRDNVMSETELVSAWEWATEKGAKVSPLTVDLLRILEEARKEFREKGPTVVGKTIGSNLAAELYSRVFHGLDVALMDTRAELFCELVWYLGQGRAMSPEAVAEFTHFTEKKLGLERAPKETLSEIKKFFDALPEDTRVGFVYSLLERHKNVFNTHAFEEAFQNTVLLHPEKNPMFDRLKRVIWREMSWSEKSFLTAKVLTSVQPDGPLGSQLDLIVTALESLGVIGRKLAQLLQFHGHFVPAELRAKLVNFNDANVRSARADIVREAEKIFESELHRKFWDEISLVHQVLGAGSFKVALHVTLKDGTDAVIKIVDPATKRRVVRNLELVKDSVEKWASEHRGGQGSLGPTALYLLNRLKKIISLEMDFGLEARNTDTHQTNIQMRAKSGRRFATPIQNIPSLCSGSVHTVQFIPHRGNASRVEPSKREARQIVSEVLDELLIDRFVHGDLQNRANLLLLNQGAPALIDLSLSQTVDPVHVDEIVRLASLIAKFKKKQDPAILQPILAQFAAMVERVEGSATKTNEAVTEALFELAQANQTGQFDVAQLLLAFEKKNLILQPHYMFLLEMLGILMREEHAALGLETPDAMKVLESLNRQIRTRIAPRIKGASIDPLCIEGLKSKT